MRLGGLHEERREVSMIHFVQEFTLPRLRLRDDVCTTKKKSFFFFFFFSSSTSRISKSSRLRDHVMSPTSTYSKKSFLGTSRIIPTTRPRYESYLDVLKKVLLSWVQAESSRLRDRLRSAADRYTFLKLRIPNPGYISLNGRARSAPGMCPACDSACGPDRWFG